MRIHSNKTMYKCRHCPKSFKYINSYRYHEGTHTAQMINCYRCGLVYRSKISYQNHLCKPENYQENAIKALEYIKRYKERKVGTPIIKTSLIVNSRNTTRNVVKTLSLKKKGMGTPRILLKRPKRSSVSTVVNYKEYDVAELDVPLDPPAVGEYMDICPASPQKMHSYNENNMRNNTQSSIDGFIHDGAQNSNDSSYNGAVNTLINACKELVPNTNAKDIEMSNGEHNATTDNGSIPIITDVNEISDGIHVKSEVIEKESDLTPQDNHIPLKHGFVTTTTILSSTVCEDSKEGIQLVDKHSQNKKTTAVDYNVLKVV